MKIRRRCFLLGTALVATTPAFVTLLSMLSPAQSQTDALPVHSPPQPVADTTDASCDLLRIDGWDCRYHDEIGDSRTASPYSVTGDGLDEPITIRISQSWRAAWR